MLVKVELLSKLCENFNKLRLLKKPKLRRTDPTTDSSI
nr:MAG TPA: hypothetical protein [Bacteriophage sp.]